MSRKYLEIFCREAEEQLALLQSRLLLLEKEPGSADLLQELLRCAHTLKGSARMMSLDEIAAISHQMEELLKGMEAGTRRVDPAGIDLLLKGADAVALITEALEADRPAGLDVAGFIEAYRRGEVAPAPPAAAAPDPEADHAAAGPRTTVRAEVEALEALANLAGELIIDRQRLELKLCRLKGMVPAADPGTATALTGFCHDLEDDLLHLDGLIQELHGRTMGLRMLPFASISEGFERLVRDLAKRLGKEARLEAVGWSIEMDRTLLDGLKPMLIHLLTNAVCHGIESPREREAAGKCRLGTVRLTACHQGSRVLVEVRDDGRGMDPARIRSAALARGLIGELEAQALSDRDALYLTLLPGFSTAEAVTEIAGRGVGLDVVQQQVERCKGELSLVSEPGAYTGIGLRLPLTLSVLEGLLVQCGGETFAIPIVHLQEIFRVRPHEIVPLGEGEGIRVEGATVPLNCLNSLLGLPRQGAPPAGGMAAVLLKLGEHRLAVTVDAHLGSLELVVKRLGRQFARVRFLFGATILGDGNPALILDVPDLFAAAAETATGSRVRERLPAAPRARVLVVDDSATTRAVERGILAGSGYRVETAVSGEDALVKTAAIRFDLVVSDVQMSGMDGFQLTRKLRASEAYRDTPVVIVSSLSRDEDKRQALAAGAQAYIVKGSFDQSVLLETVRTLIG